MPNSLVLRGTYSTLRVHCRLHIFYSIAYGSKHTKLLSPTTINKAEFFPLETIFFIQSFLFFVLFFHHYIIITVFFLYFHLPLLIFTKSFPFPLTKQAININTIFNILPLFLLESKKKRVYNKKRLH